MLCEKCKKEITEQKEPKEKKTKPGDTEKSFGDMMNEPSGLV